MTKLYFNREEEVKKFNINIVLTEALSIGILRLCDKALHTWFNDLHKSSQQLLLNKCKEHQIEILF